MHRRLIALARIAWIPLVLGIAGGVLTGLGSLAQAHLLSTAVDRIFLRGQGLHEVWPWLRLLLLVIAARGCLAFIQERASAEVAIRVKHWLRDRLFSHMLLLGPSYSHRERTGDLTVAAVDGIEALDAYYTQYLPQLAISTLVPLVILLAVLPVDPLSGIVLLLTAPLIPFFMYMIGRTAQQATSRQFAGLGTLASHLLDSINGLATLKIFGQSKAQIENIGRVAERFRSLTLRVLQLSFLSAFALELLATLGTAIIAVEVGLRLLYGQLEFQRALFLLVLAPEFYMPLRMLGARFHAGMAGGAAARRIFEVLDTPASHPEPLHPAASRLADTDCIEIRNVSFTYPERETPALSSVNLRVAAGTHVAIVGESGAGKSTLAALLLGFLRPTSGEILLREEHPWASEGSPCIAWVPQMPFLFHDSLAANVRIGKPTASDTEIAEALRLTHLDQLVESLPQGMSTGIGEGGARLSTGEAQRLALARAFVLDAPILLLDEPTASLDPETETLLDDSLRSLRANRTVITIAHRLSTVMNADEIVVLHRGSVVERGRHRELLAADGHYARLLRKQWQDRPARGVERASRSSHMEDQPAKTTGGGITPEAAEVFTEIDQPRSVFGHLLEFLHGSWRSVASAVLLATLAVTSSVALMGTSAWLISAAALHPSIADLQLAIVGVRFFGIARAVFRYLERLVSHGVTFRLLRNIRVWFYARLEPLAPARLVDFRTGDLVARAMADVETLENFYVRIMAPVLTASAMLAALAGGLVLWGAPELAAVVAAGFLLVGAAVPAWSLIRARSAGTRMIAQRGDLRVMTLDSLLGLADLAAYRQTGERARSVHELGQAYAASQRTMASLSGMQAVLVSVCMNGTMWAALLLAALRVMQGVTPPVYLAPVTLMVLASLEAVSGLPQAGQLWPATEAAARRLLAIVNVPPVVFADRHAAVPGPQELSLPSAPTSSGRAHIQFDHVDFTYPGRRRPALQDVTFAVEGGGRVAIVGQSGAGKSTIASLLLRFWEYDGGEIYLQGRSIREVASEDVREQLGYAAQRPYLFNTSILENLRLARRGVTNGEIERAASLAGLDDFIHGLPRRYDTQVGERGLNLSAGERQRLGIARAILRDAPLWILDEPTANLDAASESRVLDTLWELTRGRTWICITHRLMHMERFDEIIVMGDGAIREQGTHDSLVGRGGLYARLWTLQNGIGEALSLRLANVS